jgi:hypothetical protein
MLIFYYLLQRRPVFHMKNEKISAKNSRTNLIFELEKEKCPTGTVPIRRTTKDDLIRSKLLWNASILKSNGASRHVNFLLNNLILKVFCLFYLYAKKCVNKDYMFIQVLTAQKKLLILWDCSG